MSEPVSDPVTGLTLSLPPGWSRIAHDAFPLILVDAHPEAQETFVPNVIASVVTLNDDDDLQQFTERNTLSWAEAVNGRIVHVGGAPTDKFDGREVLGLYSEGGLAVAVHTLLFVSDGLGTRIDFSVRVWDAPEGSTYVPELIADLKLPHSAPTAVPGEAQLAELFEEVRRGVSGTAY